MIRKLTMIFGALAFVMLAGCGQQEATVDDAESPQEEHAEPAETGDVDAAADAEARTGGEVPPAIADAVANPERPNADRERDGHRRPAEVLTFFGVEPGMTVLEFIAGGGYYTEILSQVVGEDGHVYATRLSEQRNADGRLTNVTALDQEWSLDSGSVDVVFTALNYHDLYNVEGLDIDALLARFHDVLRPGGVMAVIDHAAEDGSGTRDTNTTHRIDEAVVVEDFTRAGFELAETSDLLRNSDDDRTQNVFAPGLRGQTDRFVLKFVKPGA
jgi:predicted methyltransferase